MITQSIVVRDNFVVRTNTLFFKYKWYDPEDPLAKVLYTAFCDVDAPYLNTRAKIAFIVGLCCAHMFYEEFM